MGTWPGKLPRCTLDSVELVQQVFSDSSVLCACDPCHGRYLAATLVLRGDCLLTDAAQRVTDFREANANCFVGYPDNVKITACALPRKSGSLQRECALIANNTAIQQ